MGCTCGKKAMKLNRCPSTKSLCLIFMLSLRMFFFFHFFFLSSLTSFPEWLQCFLMCLKRFQRWAIGAFAVINSSRVATVTAAHFVSIITHVIISGSERIFFNRKNTFLLSVWVSHSHPWNCNVWRLFFRLDNYGNFYQQERRKHFSSFHSLVKTRIQ